MRQVRSGYGGRFMMLGSFVSHTGWTTAWAANSFDHLRGRPRAECIPLEVLKMCRGLRRRGRDWTGRSSGLAPRWPFAPELVAGGEEVGDDGPATALESGLLTVWFPSPPRTQHLTKARARPPSQGSSSTVPSMFGAGPMVVPTAGRMAVACPRGLLPARVAFAERKRL